LPVPGLLQRSENLLWLFRNPKQTARCKATKSRCRYPLFEGPPAACCLGMQSRAYSAPSRSRAALMSGE